MNFKKSMAVIGIIISSSLGFLRPPALSGYELFVYRIFEQKMPLSKEKKIHVHGELFGQIHLPSTFPSYNDLSGEEDRWNFGFHNYIFITEGTFLHAQLVTHDDGGRRTKFDWHFSLRQNLNRNIVLVIGHDSDHDSDHVSYLRGRSYYTNRNYVGISLPFSGKTFLIEPFTWFFHHTNQRTSLDLSGDKLKQEYGLRLGALVGEYAALSLQFIVQSDTVFCRGQTWLLDMVFRFRLAKWLELSLGAGWWKDGKTSAAGLKQSFSKLIWGMAVAF